MLKTIIDELDWFAKILIIAAAAFFALDYTARAEDGWSKGTDGYYYKQGDTSAPYEATPYTAWERVRYVDSYGCYYYKNVAVTKYKYTRVYKITEKTSIDELALYMAGIKAEEIRSELRNREDRAKVNRVRELAEIWGFDQYRLQDFGLHLDYGDDYQFPAQVGDTSYATKIVRQETYGDTRLPLVEAMAMQKELQLAGKHYAHESETAWQGYTKEIVDNEGARIAYERQLDRQNETIGVLSDTLLNAIKLTTPTGSKVEIEESHYESSPKETGPTNFKGAEVDPWKLWIGMTKASCAACHDKHADVASENFPEGLDPANLAGMSDFQLDAVANYVGAGHCPPKDNALGVAPLTTRQKKWAVNFLASIHKGE